MAKGKGKQEREADEREAQRIVNEQRQRNRVADIGQVREALKKK